MIQKVYTVQNIKTGRVFKMTQTGLNVAKKHGLDKDWDVLPLSDIKDSYIADKQKVTEEFDDTAEFTDPFVGITDESEEEQIKPKRKYNKKQKNG